MSAVAFEAVADSLREAVLSYYAERSESLRGPAGHNTLETNSGWVERRSAPLLRILRSRGVVSIDGAEIVDIGCGFGAMSVFFAAHGARVVGVDPNGSRLEVGRAVAARHGLAVEFMQGRMEDLSMLQSSRFDVAVHNNSFCYVIAGDTRRVALRETLRVLHPGGWLVSRNPNRWNPLDQFTGLPLIHLLPLNASNRLARALGRERSCVRLRSPVATRRELRVAGFTDVRQAGFEGERPDVLKPVARYHHFTARRPPTPDDGPQTG